MKNKQNATPLSPDVVRAVQETTWRNFSSNTKAWIIALLQGGETPERIESHMAAVIARDYPAWPAWKQQEFAGRYYLAAYYAKSNNLHLN